MTPVAVGQHMSGPRAAAAEKLKPDKVSVSMPCYHRIIYVFGVIFSLPFIGFASLKFSLHLNGDISFLFKSGNLSSLALSRAVRIIIYVYVCFIIHIIFFPSWEVVGYWPYVYLPTAILIIYFHGLIYSFHLSFLLTLN